MTGSPQRVPRVTRVAWSAAGLGCVAVGGVGVVVPGLPTTIFFIGAAACFTRSSPRLEAWVLGLPSIGPAVRDYRAGLGMPRKAKVLAITMLTVFVSLSIWVIGSWWLRVALAIAAAIGVTVILRTPTRRTA